MTRIAGWADKLQGKTIPVSGEQFVYVSRRTSLSLSLFFFLCVRALRGRDWVQTVHEPVGVVGAIIP